ncbi:MAG: hypothetical protein SVT52_05490 [Planctomycetota bacterium]|nr:hypothetical protein [Planctomycetota bacterium]
MPGSDTHEFDGRLLGLIQTRVPLLRQPWAQIAAELGCDEQKVLCRVKALRGEGGLIRQICGIFDVTALGYHKALIAMALEPEKLDAAGAAAADHPGVSHCYGRTGRYNLWLTLATSPSSRLGPEKTAQALAARCGASSCLLLPGRRRYKLNLRFNAFGDDTLLADAPCEPAGPTPDAAATSLTDVQVRAVRALQLDLPAAPEPFTSPAEAMGLAADELLVHAADFLAAGLMRRYAALLDHRAAGAEANVLVVWRVAPADADAAGAMCAQLPAVSHCYLRDTADDWPYGLYTMIHGRRREDCEATIRRIAASTGISDYMELWTLKQYAKRCIRLFGEEESAWERAQV